MLHRKLARRFGPRFSMGALQARIAGLGENDWLRKAALYVFYRLHHHRRIETVWQWVVVVEADVVERIPELDRFKFGSLRCRIDQRSAIDSTHSSDYLT